uniref:Uncharacterized protein n=1 Tax=Anopheles darlingi TaxID=43151 RepID=A0A2M4DID9_ANODA
MILGAHVAPIAVIALVGRCVLLDSLFDRRQLVAFLLVVPGNAGIFTNHQVMYGRFLLRLVVTRLDVQMRIGVDTF